MANNAKLFDPTALIQAGIDPKTGLPARLGCNGGPDLKDAIKKQLRILDMQNACHRYVWKNLPNGLTGQLIERILYYRGQAAFFYMESDGNFYFLPYALNGTIDVYGRFRSITPVAFNGVNKDEKDRPWIQGLIKNVIYDPWNEKTYEDMVNGCVLLSDYSNQMSQTNIPRQILQDPILDTMAEAFPMSRTSLIANSGVKGMRVNSEDEQANVKAASRSLARAALSGDPWVPIVSQIDFQDLTNGTALKTEEYLLYMQAMDNYRLSLYGLKNGGLFQKKSHMLESEQEMNDGNTSLVYQDGLTLRQHFCDIVNSIWGLGIAVVPCEQVTGLDTNGDGYVGDNDTSNQIDAQNSQVQEVAAYE